MAPPWVESSPAFKLFIKDLISLSKEGVFWLIDFGNGSAPRPVHMLQLQGEVANLSGMNHECILLSDGTGKARITHGCKIPGDLSWLKIGAKCSVVGELETSAKIPHVKATKISQIENKVLEQMWPLEVEELRNLFSNAVQPRIET